jgi:DNA-binding HxlR family transcriptional regulator
MADRQINEMTSASRLGEPNSLGLGSLVLGDRWNLLILREAFRGVRRFNEWAAALPISDPVLSTRLNDLTALGLLSRIPSRSTPSRHEYYLTDRAKDMWQIFVAIWLWDLRWTTPSNEFYQGHRPRLHHDDCGFAIQPLLACSHCPARGVTPFETAVVRYPNHGHDASNPPRPYRRSQARSSSTDLDAVELLGDRWSTSVLAAAFLGARRFSDFGHDIGSIPPLILTHRLNTFVEARLLIQRPVAEGKRRMEYHLTAKGSDFFGIFSNEISWSSRTFADRGGPPLAIRHLPCSSPFEPVYVCNVCNKQIERPNVAFQYPASLNAASGSVLSKQAVPQLSLKHFPNCAPRKFGDNLEAFGQLEGGHLPALKILGNLRKSDTFSLARNNEDAYSFAQTRIRHADGGHFRDLRMVLDQVLDVGRRNLESAANYEVF